MHTRRLLLPTLMVSLLAVACGAPDDDGASAAALAAGGSGTVVAPAGDPQTPATERGETPAGAATGTAEPAVPATATPAGPRRRASADVCQALVAAKPAGRVAFQSRVPHDTPHDLTDIIARRDTYTYQGKTTHRLTLVVSNVNDRCAWSKQGIEPSSERTYSVSVASDAPLTTGTFDKGTGLSDAEDGYNLVCNEAGEVGGAAGSSTGTTQTRVTFTEITSTGVKGEIVTEWDTIPFEAPFCEPPVDPPPPPRCCSL